MAENDALLEMFVYENMNLLEQLENMLLGSEENAELNKEQIDETFRVMHTIKGSSAMMSYDNMAGLAHAIEDLFSKIREKSPKESQWGVIFDSVLEGIDFFKEEIEKIQNGQTPDGEANDLAKQLRDILAKLNNQEEEQEEQTEEENGEEIVLEQQENREKPADAQQTSANEDNVIDMRAEDLPNIPLNSLTLGDGDKYYLAKIKFENECQMETIRAFGAIISIKDLYTSLVHFPEDIENNCDDEIAMHGLTIVFTASEDNAEVIKSKLEETMFLQSIEFQEIDESKLISGKEESVEVVDQPEQATQEVIVAVAAQEKSPVNNAEPAKLPSTPPKPPAKKGDTDDKPLKQSFISVNVNKIDKLMNLVGEIVTTESMVTKNPDIADLHLENFDKQARLLRKLTDELQDIVMSIRMVPIASTFNKMQRIVRDMCKKVNKNAELVIIGEDTEVDKNVNDNLSDPLMHLIRNAMDHGLETDEEREKSGKKERSRITLEAKNSGGDVIVKVSDNGRGLNREKIIQKAIEKGLTTKAESEISDKEAFGFVLLPGFSTKDQATEFSGRGVGMDVVSKNIDNIGGSILIESEEGKGTTITMHIPLTLAIMDGMKISVGDSIYIVPTLTIRESLEPKLHKIIVEPNGNEMIIIRGECYPILRLHSTLNVNTAVETFNDGIMVLVDSEAGAACLFADKLLGEQQAVVKPMPLYITRIMGRIKGIAGCSIMGDGNIALILDINNLLTD